MKYIRFIVTIWFSFFQTSVEYAQGIQIDSLKIHPGNPTTNDQISAIAFVRFPIVPCNMTSFDLFVADSVITINARHLHVGVNFPCSTIDTILLGTCNAGTYKLVYNLADTLSTIIYFSDSIYFTVLQPTATYSYQKQSFDITILPNPGNSKLQIKIYNPGIYRHTLTANIYSAQGVSVKYIDLNQETSFINIQDLAPNIYFMIIRDCDKILYRNKIIIAHRNSG